MACLKKDVKMQAGYNQSTDKVHNVFVTGCLLVNDADQGKVVGVETDAVISQQGSPGCDSKDNEIQLQQCNIAAFHSSDHAPYSHHDP